MNNLKPNFNTSVKNSERNVSTLSVNKTSAKFYTKKSSMKMMSSPRISTNSKVTFMSTKKRNVAETEFSNNWKKVFVEIYQKLSHLNSYATINNLAMQKILKKFIKEHFELKDNVVDKNFKEMINNSNFNTRT